MLIMRSHRAAAVVWIFILVAIFAGLFVLYSNYDEICSEAEITEHKDCSTYGLTIFAVVEIGKFFEEHDGAITALATIAIATFTLTLWGASARQIRDARILQRAYLSAEPMGIRPFGYDINMLGYVGFKNTGHVPARNATYFTKVEASANREQFSDGFSIPEHELSGQNVVTPGSVMVQAAQAVISKDDVEVIKRGDSFVYVWGTIRYDDGFGGRRFTNFCHRYNFRGYLADPRTMDEAALSAESGRYHEWGNDAD
jgi:hypothetical protein